MKWMIPFVAPAASLLLCGSARVTTAFSLASPTRTGATSSTRRHAEQQDSAFAAFADSLEEDPEPEEPWQTRLEELLVPNTSLAKRQVLLSELVSDNQEIRSSVETALKERKIDPLLTPTGKKLQEGTRAVARQLTTDILPSLASAARAPPSPAQLNDMLPKIGSRVLNALNNQARQAMTDLQSDLQDPSRIPQRLSQQREEFAKEAKNVFMETPEGLEGPKYEVVAVKEGYEIRDYPGYTVASTTMGKVGEPFSMDDVASEGAAFNVLAAYLFGGNQEGKAMDMTTPVTTTSMGEMRFYLAEKGDIPMPVQDSSNSQYETGAVQIVDIQPARLAVKRFTGFVTEGEVARQKDVLLNELAFDGVELDLPHGSVVPHVIFQYNPPYTIPILRRNEIAVPVAIEKVEAVDLETEWGRGDEDISPSDVE